MSIMSREEALEIMQAIIAIGDSEGASLDEIQKYLASSQKNEIELERIQSNLNDAVATGLLLKMDNGKYKVKCSTEQAKTSTEDSNNDDKVQLHHENNEIMKAARSAKENGKKLECSVDKAAQDLNRNADSDTTKFGTSMAKKDSNSPLPDDNDKNDKESIKGQMQPQTKKVTAENKNNLDKILPKLQITEDNEVKAEGRLAKGVQEAERSIDRVAQDTNRNIDFDTGNVCSSLEKKKEDTKASFPADIGKNDKEKEKSDKKKDE